MAPRLVVKRVRRVCGLGYRSTRPALRDIDERAVGEQGPSPTGQPFSSQITSPLVTVAPTSALSPVTVPALWALSGCSIFIASMTTIVSPSATVSPSVTATLTIVPCIGDVTASPDAAAPAFLPPERRGRLAATPATAPATIPSPAGSTTSSRFPPTSTVTDCRSAASGAAAAAPAYGGIR